MADLQVGSAAVTCVRRRSIGGKQNGGTWSGQWRDHTLIAVVARVKRRPIELICRRVSARSG
jgi:hypothetical protein